MSTGAAAQSAKGRKHFANDLIVPILGELDEFWNGQEKNELYYLTLMYCNSTQRLEDVLA